jgi:hypothetical protein
MTFWWFSGLKQWHNFRKEFFWCAVVLCMLLLRLGFRLTSKPCQRRIVGGRSVNSPTHSVRPCDVRCCAVATTLQLVPPMVPLGLDYSLCPLRLPPFMRAWYIDDPSLYSSLACFTCKWVNNDSWGLVRRLDCSSQATRFARQHRRLFLVSRTLRCSTRPLTGSDSPNGAGTVGLYTLSIQSPEPATQTLDGSRVGFLVIWQL